MKICMNDYIKVKLTPIGVDMFYHKDDKLRNDLIQEHPERQKYYEDLFKPRMPKIDENGFTKLLLWKFIELYGDCFHMGMVNSPIENCSIYYDEIDDDK